MEKIELVDKILLIILIILMITKLVKSGTIIIVSHKYKQKGRADKCYFLRNVTNGPEKYMCCNYLFSKKHFNDGRCDRENCNGFTTSKISTEEVISSSLFLNVLLKIIDTLIDFITCILIFRVLILHS